MFGKIFSALGTFVGRAVGGGIFGTIARTFTSFLGKEIEHFFDEPDEHYSSKGKRAELQTPSAAYGSPIPIVFGRIKVQGHLIWFKGFKEESYSNSIERYTKDERLKAIHHVTEYSYTATFAIGICAGPIDSVGKAWAQGSLIDIKMYKYRLYSGNESQMPDSLILNHSGNATAFRGLAYIVFEDFPLADFGNKVPHFAFEVIRQPIMDTIQHKIKSMIMIPGSGEFVYDTNIQKKMFIENGVVTREEPINCHNEQQVANSLYSLSELRAVCPNLEWVAPVACWFTNSLDIKTCEVYPAVEYGETRDTRTSEEWNVAGYTRSNARVIGQNERGGVRYGGSINDASIIRYLKALRQSNLKIMFYPMVFVDIEGKPWRGHISGSDIDVPEFFNKHLGYNNFILHYANLVKGMVDAFVIGSELVGITRIHNANHSFPAVKELISLAQEVKNILGEKVIVTYAADWSEYHHTDGGWYHLDDLWASDAIDVIGIDSYFPLTNSIQSGIRVSEIFNGWSSGEHWDFIRKDNHETAIESRFACKNIQHWWENYHQNPDNNTTKWKPKSKKIWFTEFGFPSIDKSPNQPNVFYDPYCVDGNIPHHSSGTVDFAIQRASINATLKFWKNSDIVQNMFLWCWDARPYPAWPHSDVWTDGYLWEKGHWVNHKLMSTNLRDVLLELCMKGNIDQNNIVVDDLDVPIEGIIFNQTGRIWDAISMLRCSYFFDVITAQDNIIFNPRGFISGKRITEDHLIKYNKTQYIGITNVADSQIIQKIRLGFLNQNRNYEAGYVYLAYSDVVHNAKSVKIPIAMTSNQALALADVILKNAWSENQIFHFAMALTDLDLEPSEVIYLLDNYLVRIINIGLEHNNAIITALLEEVSSYKSHTSIIEPYVFNQIIHSLNVIELPLLPGQNIKNIYLYISMVGEHAEPLYLGLNKDMRKISELYPKNYIGTLIYTKNSNAVNHLRIDTKSEIILSFPQELSNIHSDEQNFWYGNSIIMVGMEIIAYRDCVRIGHKKYKFSYFMRGLCGTEEHISLHKVGEKCIILDLKSSIALSTGILGQELYYKTDSMQNLKSMVIRGKSLQIPKVRNCIYKIIDNKIQLSWVGRNRSYDDWQNVYEADIKFYKIITKYDDCVVHHTSITNTFTLNLPLSDELDIRIIACGAYPIVESEPVSLTIKLK